jgi:ABC transporter DrrB family efflux protein
VAFASFGTGIGLNEDLSKGMIDRFRSLPIARSAYLTGRILADTVRIMGNVLLLAGVGALLGLRFQAGPVPALGAFLLATAFGVAMAWVAALIGLAARNPETVNSVGFIWMLPLTFASSAFVPVASMPGWLQAFAEVNPITVNVDALRALVLGGPTATPVLQALAWIAGITVVFWVLAVRQYRRIA